MTLRVPLWGRLVTICLLAATAASRAFCAPATPTIWEGPMPFMAARTLRPDFFPTLRDPQAWPTVLGRAQVFKSYLMVLPDVPVEGKTAPELSDAQMAQLAALCKARGLRVAFEVGGLRQGPDAPDEHWGEKCAEGELRWLRRWLKVGGTIDYLTTDHAVMMNLGSPYVQPGKYRDCGFAMAQTIDQLVDYFVAVRRELPQVRLGVIESLGFFHVTGPDAREYARTVPALPAWHFEDYFTALLAAMQRRGLQLDHFHIDFGYEGVRHDGGGQGKLDYGRVLGVERCVQFHGVRAGVIVNAFDDRSAAPPDPVTANCQACDNTRAFLAGYLAAGGQADDLVLQTWQPYPDHTGPQTDPLSVLGLHRSLLQMLPAGQ